MYTNPDYSSYGKVDIIDVLTQLQRDAERDERKQEVGERLFNHPGFMAAFMVDSDASRQAVNIAQGQRLAAYYPPYVNRDLLRQVVAGSDSLLCFEHCGQMLLGFRDDNPSVIEFEFVAEDSATDELMALLGAIMEDELESAATSLPMPSHSMSATDLVRFSQEHPANWVCVPEGGFQVQPVIAHNDDGNVEVGAHLADFDDFIERQTDTKVKSSLIMFMSEILDELDLGFIEEPPVS